MRIDIHGGANFRVPNLSCTIFGCSTCFRINIARLSNGLQSIAKYVTINVINRLE